MIQSVKEKAGDSVQLGLIVGYEGNIHAGGSLVIHVSGSALGTFEGEKTAVESNTIYFFPVHCWCTSLPVFVITFCELYHFLSG